MDGSDALNSQAVKAVYTNTGSCRLPMAYPEGSPAHPSYPAGHAAIAGACVTVLKAFFNENITIPAPVVASADGTALQAYDGALTVGDELHKLAANISLARDAAGIRYLSDGIVGLRLGEAVAVQMLHDVALTFTKTFPDSLSPGLMVRRAPSVQPAEVKGGLTGRPGPSGRSGRFE
jgi:hypothetical protein